jgi:biotin-(acetyl-CoA carboxylase) ligase
MNMSNATAGDLGKKKTDAFLEGEAIDLDEDGALLIRKDNGLVIKKTAGDVFLI